MSLSIFQIGFCLMETSLGRRWKAGRKKKEHEDRYIDNEEC